jgi:hypothetical protein
MQYSHPVSDAIRLRLQPQQREMLALLSQTLEAGGVGKGFIGASIVALITTAHLSGKPLPGLPPEGDPAREGHEHAIRAFARGILAQPNLPTYSRAPFVTVVQAIVSGQIFPDLPAAFRSRSREYAFTLFPRGDAEWAPGARRAGAGPAGAGQARAAAGNSSAGQSRWARASGPGPVSKRGGTGSSSFAILGVLAIVGLMKSART